MSARRAGPVSWLRLLACCSLVEADLRNRLRSDFGSQLAHLDALAQIARKPQALTMSQLSERLMREVSAAPAPSRG